MMLNELEEILRKCYSKETTYYKNREEWSRKNPTSGQCAITALIVQDYFGGTIHRVKVKNETHYFNIINEQIVDFTKEQFEVKNVQVIYDNSELINRGELLANADTLQRYNMLKKKLGTGIKIIII